MIFSDLQGISAKVVGFSHTSKKQSIKGLCTVEIKRNKLDERKYNVSNYAPISITVMKI